MAEVLLKVETKLPNEAQMLILHESLSVVRDADVESYAKVKIKVRTW